MFILDVIPLTLLPPQVPQVLSYFSDRVLEKGALVRVSINRRIVSAIVVSHVPLAQNKLTVKKSQFELKPITDVTSETPLVSTRQFALARWMAHHYFAPLGLCLKTILPSFFGKRGHRHAIDVHAPLPDHEQDLDELFVVLDAKSVAAYVRMNLSAWHTAPSSQVLFLVPDVAVAQALANALAEREPLLVHSGLSSRAYADAWRRIADGSSRLIIGTRSVLSMSFPHLTTILIEDPGHEFYKSDSTPRYDAVALARQIAASYGARVIYLASHIPIEYAPRALPTEYLAPGGTAIEYVDMGREVRSGNFSPFGRQLQGLLLEEAGIESILLFSARKAYAASLVCHSCGFLFSCAACTAPMRVHRTPVSPRGGPENMLVCYHCGAYHEVPPVCPQCHNVQLRPAGMFGSQKIQEALQELLRTHGASIPPVFIFDGDLVRTPAHEEELFSRVRRATHPVVIATSLILHHRYTHSFDRIVVVNADGLLSNPDFRTEDRMLATVAKLRGMTTRTLVCQSYDPTRPVFRALATREHAEFIHEELAARRTLSYPPFSRIVKLSFRHRSYERAFTAARQLVETLKMASARLTLEHAVRIVGPAPAFIARENNTFTQNVILKLDPSLRVGTILKFVPSEWLIDVDPRNVV